MFRLELSLIVTLCRFAHVQLRWYCFVGDSLLQLRQKYLELTGYPLLPPKRNFGMFQVGKSMGEILYALLIICFLKYSPSIFHNQTYVCFTFRALLQSLFGYRSWDHVNVDLDSIVNPMNSFERFPVDAVALDIYV